MKYRILTWRFHLSCWFPILWRAADLPSILPLVVITVMLSLLDTVEMSSLSGVTSWPCNIIWNVPYYEVNTRVATSFPHYPSSSVSRCFYKVLQDSFSKLKYLFLSLLSVRVLLPLGEDGINEEKISHVEGKEADDAEDHADDNLDDDRVPLLVSTNTSGTKCFWKLFHMIFNIETGNDDIETITVTTMQKYYYYYYYY